MTVVAGAVLIVMDEAMHKDYVEAGCDPACHVCSETIAAGDEYGMRVFLPEQEVITVTGGAMRAQITGMACAQCIAENREWPEEERAKMMRRLTRVIPSPIPRAPAPGPEGTAVDKPPPRPAGRGCFYIGDQAF